MFSLTKKGANVLSLKTILAGAILLLSVGCVSAPKKSANDLYRASVKVTNEAGTSGGSGTILRSSDLGSFVLTNAHVCGVVEKGGKVTGVNGSFAVTGYKKSKAHDLCLIKVSGNLGYNVKIAKRAPRLQYEKVAISGFPHLLPNVVSRGQYSGLQNVTVLIGIRKCVESDMKDENKALACALLGGVPILRSYDAVLVSATIQPGNSGSGVYNSENELSGVAFAGMGDFGYAMTVPYSYVMNFLFKEQRNLRYESPKDTTGDEETEEDKKELQDIFMHNLQKVCQPGSPVRNEFKELCNMDESGLLL